MVKSSFVEQNNFNTRKDASDGLWVAFLLPLSIFISAIRNSVVLTNIYYLIVIFTIGITLSTISIIVLYVKGSKLYTLSTWNIFAAIITTVIFEEVSNSEWEFAALSAVFSCILYIKLYLFLMRNLPNTFTLGEGALVAQALSIFYYGFFLTVLNFSESPKKTDMQIATIIIQFGLFGLICVGYFSYAFKIKTPHRFYFLLFFVVIFVIVFPLHLFIEEGPFIWLYNQIFRTKYSIFLMIYWLFCSLLMALILNYQVSNAKKASTARRKIFHFVLVAIFIPGLFYKCSLLYLASGVALGALFFMDLLRIAKIPPFEKYLQDGFVVFKDEKDEGLLALTPIYLFCGCSLPIWIHPAPCDVTDTSMFCFLPLLSGLLSVGIGDAFASCIGSKYGRYKWKDSKKTIEGSLACIISQFAFVYVLVNFGIIQKFGEEELIRCVIAVILGAYVEAKITQVDNIVLPLITYCILV